MILPTLYQGTKRVYAQPMNRGEYNAYRNWEVPTDENPADEGYLVEYVDGGRSNDPRHAGYISWSPKDVFERAYKPVSQQPDPYSDLPPYQQRVIAEKAELDERIEKLDAFLVTTTFHGLPASERNRLMFQGSAMRIYSRVLADRIAAFGGNEAPEAPTAKTEPNYGDAPRVTPADIEAEIASEHYFTAADGAAGAGPIIAAEFWHRTNGHTVVDYGENTCFGVLSEEKGYERRPLVYRPEPAGPLALLTFCVLVLRNGFTVTGESACASHENFDVETGRRIARENAVSKLWPLLGFRFKDNLHDLASGPK